MDFIFKISLIGDEFTGKTSLILRYLNDTFSEGYKATLGADFMDKTYTVEELPFLQDSDIIKLTIWDMAGQSHFDEIVKIYFEGSHGMVLVFDITNQDSFKNIIEKWKDVAQQICPDAEILIVGNKIDLEHNLSQESIDELRDELNCEVLLTSAKDNENVDTLFHNILEKIYKKALE